MNQSMFRAEAIAHHEGANEVEGDILRVDRSWTRHAYRMLVAVVVVGFIFMSTLSVDEYAEGPAVVRVEGRRMVTATSPGTVEGVEVRPGQWVDAGAVLVRMYATDEAAELARASHEFELALIRMLRDPNDADAKATLATLRARKEQAKINLDARVVRADVAGTVSDVRVQPGQRVEPGEVLAAVAPKDASQISLVAMVPADYRPMLRSGQKMRFELDGFKFEYADLDVETVSAEAVGPTEVQRFLGKDRADAVHLDPGAKVFVSAKLPASTFSSEGESYGYFDGLTGTASVRVRREPILVMLVPPLRVFLPQQGLQ